MNNKPENIERLLEGYLINANTWVDSLINYRDILKKPYRGSGYTRSTKSVDKKFTLDVIKVTDTHIIAKIIDRNAPFVIPKVGDKVFIIID